MNERSCSLFDERLSEVPHPGAVPRRHSLRVVQRELRQSEALGLFLRLSCSAELKSGGHLSTASAGCERQLKDADIRQIKARLGARGDLPLGLYDIDIDPPFRAPLGRRGIRPSHIEEALRAPDAFRHTSSELHDNLRVSLFVKGFGSGKDAFTLFAVARRDACTLRVRYAMRVYDADVNMDHATEPLAVLRAFLNRYGLEVQIGRDRGFCCSMRSSLSAALLKI